MVSFGFDIQDLINENRVSINNILSIQEWLEKENSIPKINKKQIAIFLIASDNNVDNTKKCIFQYYLTRKNAPEIFDNRDVTKQEIIKQLDSLELAIIPKRTPNNCVIVINRLSNSNASLYHLDIAMKLIFMSYDALLYDNPPDGIIMMFDMSLVTLRHISRVKINTIKTISHYAQECIPVKLKEIHVMNVLWFFDKIFILMKPFLNRELLNKIHLHLSSDIENFYENYVSKSYLPKDYGGELPSVAELHDQTYQKLLSMAKYFIEEENQRKDFFNKML